MSKNIRQNIRILETVLDKVPEIRYAGKPVLRQATQTTTRQKGIETANRLMSALQAYRDITGWGRGLAAPQIGEGVSVFITFVDDRFEVFINPKIVERSKKTNFYKEVCMSVGILSADVERPDWIVMEWMDEKGKNRSEKFNGFKARLYQHEEAHLRGRLNVDDAVPGGIEFVTFDPLEEKLRDER